MAEKWCEEHQTEYFKKGHMKGYAHPIGDTGKWCNEEKQKPSKSEGDHVIDAPLVKEMKEPNFRSPVNRSVALSYVKDIVTAEIIAGILKTVNEDTYKQMILRAELFADWIDK